MSESWHEWGMPQFLKSLTDSFIGKVLGALFIAICFALGVGPDKWANFMIQNLPIWITPNVARASFLGFGLLTLLAVFRPWEWRKSQRLEQIPAKLHDFADKDLLQHIDLARFLFGKVIPPCREAR